MPLKTPTFPGPHFKGGEESQQKHFPLAYLPPSSPCQI